MNRKRAFCGNELTITLALASIGLGIFLPLLQFLLKQGPSVRPLSFLGMATALPVAMLILGRWAERRKNYDLQDICGLGFILTALPGAGAAIGMLYFLSKAIGPLPW